MKTWIGGLGADSPRTGTWPEASGRHG